MGNVPSDFYLESHLINHSVAIEPEGGGGGVIAGTSTGNWDTMVRCRAQLRIQLLFQHLDVETGADRAGGTGSILTSRTSTRGSGSTAGG